MRYASNIFIFFYHRIDKLARVEVKKIIKNACILKVGYVKEIFSELIELRCSIAYPCRKEL